MMCIYLLNEKYFWGGRFGLENDRCLHTIRGFGLPKVKSLQLYWPSLMFIARLCVNMFFSIIIFLTPNAPLCLVWFVLETMMKISCKQYSRIQIFRASIHAFLSQISCKPMRPKIDFFLERHSVPLFFQLSCEFCRWKFVSNQRSATFL